MDHGFRRKQEPWEGTDGMQPEAAYSCALTFRSNKAVCTCSENLQR